jgi:hypothetical protein
LLKITTMTINRKTIHTKGLRFQEAKTILILKRAVRDLLQQAYLLLTKNS